MPAGGGSGQEPNDPATDTRRSPGNGRRPSRIHNLFPLNDLQRIKVAIYLHNFGLSGNMAPEEGAVGARFAGPIAKSVFELRNSATDLFQASLAPLGLEAPARAAQAIEKLSTLFTTSGLGQLAVPMRSRHEGRPQRAPRLGSARDQLPRGISDSVGHMRKVAGAAFQGP
jgi:hypothetical protein